MVIWVDWSTGGGGGSTVKPMAPTCAKVLRGNASCGEAGVCTPSEDLAHVGAIGLALHLFSKGSNPDSNALCGEVGCACCRMSHSSGRDYMGTSPIRNRAPLGPYSRTMRRVLGRS